MSGSSEEAGALRAFELPPRIHAVAPLTTYGGNLIATLDFFHALCQSYRSLKLDSLLSARLAALGFPHHLVLIKTAAHSLDSAHLRIVHSD